jgi:hypothetical protein
MQALLSETPTVCHTSQWKQWLNPKTLVKRSNLIFCRVGGALALAEMASELQV